MNINPVSPVQWAGPDAHGSYAKSKFSKDETAKAAETLRPVDATEQVKPVQPNAPEATRAAPPSVLQLKIQEMLSEQADQLEKDKDASETAA